MAKLKITTGDGVAAPGQDAAKKHAEEQKNKVETGAPPLFSAEGQEFSSGPDYTYSRIRFRKSDEVNPYADSQDERYGFDPRVKPLVIMAVLLILVFLVSVLVPTNMFSIVYRSDHSIGGYAREVASNFQHLVSIFSSKGDVSYTVYVLQVLATVLAGAAMGLSGGVFQGAMKNALASPSTLGVTQGGALGAIIYAVFVYPNTIGANYSGTVKDYMNQVSALSLLDYLQEIYGSFFCALLGCVVVVLLVMLIALIAGRGKVSNASLVIAGQVFSAVIVVVINWIKYYLINTGESDAAEYLNEVQTVSFSGAYTPVSMAMFAIPLFVCFAVILIMTPRLTLLAFNDDEARSMGVSTTVTRNVMVGVCTVMTALVVSFCGVVGFVGFMVPHIARRFLGPDFRYLLPGCMVLGAVLVSITHFFTVLGIPWIPSGSTGMYTSIIGCLMFLVMALRTRGDSRAEWF